MQEYPLLQTKLHIPAIRPELVSRPRLLERLNVGLDRKLTLVSAPAGFGKTTAVTQWLKRAQCHPAWLSLDESDNDPTTFLAYLVVALQALELWREPGGKIGQGVLSALRSPQPPSARAILTSLINDLAVLPARIVLVLDDYHVIEAQAIHDALSFFLEHLPQRMHLIIATREDPPLPLARLRAQSELTELRVADLRFTQGEAAEFLNQMMGLELSAENIAALKNRTEGWIAGLQLAAVSMQGQKDVTDFIESFAGSHHFVMDYLVAEVLQRQPDNIQTFLLRTSILERLCGSLCDAVLGESSTPGQESLEYLERTNLFVIPLDHERRWYRYHHLFADLLRQRLQRSVSSVQHEGLGVHDLHSRASRWYEESGDEVEAFRHAAAAGEVDHAARLIEGKGVPLYVRGALIPVLNWLESLPKTELDKKPALWLMYARALTTAGQTSGVEEKLQAAEAALQGAELNTETRNMIGSIASNRATLAYTKYRPDTVIAQAQRALEYLSPDDLPTRAMTTLTLGVGYMQKGNRPAAIQAFADARRISQAIGHTFVTAMATMALGNMQEMENRLYLAAETQRQALQLFGDQPIIIAYESHLSLARISYQWNDLESAQHHGEKSVRLARQYDESIDRYIICEVFLARLQLALGDGAAAAALLDETSRSVRRHNFVHRMPEVAAAQVLTFLRQGNLAAAAHLAQTHQLPLSQARVHLAQGDRSAALAVLEPVRQQVEAKGWADELLKVMVLQAVALQTDGQKHRAVQLLGDTLALAEPDGFIRIFLDEGLPMAQLLSEAAAQGMMPDYVGKLLAAFEAERQESEDKSYSPPPQPLIEPLSQRELEVLQLIAQGLSNREISERLFLALSTVKGHNRNIYGKLQVQRRTEAVARARELGLL